MLESPCQKSSVRSLLSKAGVVWLSLMASVACAAADAGHVLHKAKSSETVHSLVGDYLQGQGALAEFIHINHLTHPAQVIAGLVVKLPRQHLKFRPSVAKITRLNCGNALRTDLQPATTLQTGMQLSEGAVVRIPSGCQMVLTLEDESNVRLLSGAVLKLSILRQRVFETAPAVRVDLLDGRVAVDVPRKRPGEGELLEVRTPTSVAGVRGTEFRVAFDAQDRQSRVEVLTGGVGARGLTEPQEQKVTGGQGVMITAQGQSQPVETLLAPPRYARLAAQRSGGEDRLIFQGDPQARSFVVTTAQDALFVDALQDHGRLSVAEFPAAGLSTRAKFMRWGAVTASGLLGAQADYGICQGEKLQDIWRCDLVFNLSDLVQPQMRLERVMDQAVTGAAAVQVLLDAPVDTAKDPVWLLRNLPVGRYRWRIGHQTGTGQQALLAGAFELIAVRAQD